MRIDTKRVMIDATKDMLRQESRFTVKDICDRAYTNIAAVNYHFGDKENLVRTAMNEILGEFKQSILLLLADEDMSSERVMASVLNALLDFHMEYRGAVKYMLLKSDEEGVSNLIIDFLLERSFTDSLLRRISRLTGETDRQVLFYKYSIAASAFILPLFLEETIGNEYLSLTGLAQPEKRAAFIGQIQRLFQ